MKLSLFVGLFATLFVFADDVEPKDPNAPKPREIKIAKGKFGFVRGRFARPTVIASAEELEKAFPDKAMRQAITKQVDLKKEQLLLFRWSGSGMDKVSFKTRKIEDGEEVVFTYTPGRTRDLRSHTKLYAIPKKMTYRIGK